MIVKIIEIRLKDTRNSNSFPTRTTNRRGDLAHREHDPTKLHQLLAQPVNPKLHLLGIDGVVEELVLYVFNHVVEMLNGIEMAVNKDIENSVDDTHRPIRDEVRVRVEAVEYLRDLWQIVAMNTNDAVREHPHRNPRDDQTTVGIIGLTNGRGVSREEEMVRIAGNLRALAGSLGILNSVKVQIKLIGQDVDVLTIRSGEVVPAKRPGIGEFLV